MPRDRRFAVIGLGEFGRAAARELASEGHRVFAIDARGHVVHEVQGELPTTDVVQADATNARALRELAVQAAEAVVVALGDDLEDTMLTMLNLLDLGAPRIIVRARGERQAAVLRLVGGAAVRIVTPEADAGTQAAREILG